MYWSPRLNKTWNSVVIAVAAGGILAGASGLILAGGTQADVAALKAAQPILERRMEAVEQGLAGLTSATEVRATADAEHRTQIKGDLSRLDGKLDALLRRP